MTSSKVRPPPFVQCVRCPWEVRHAAGRRHNRNQNTVQGGHLRRRCHPWLFLCGRGARRVRRAGPLILLRRRLRQLRAVPRGGASRGGAGPGRAAARRGPHRGAFLSGARGSSGWESPGPAPRGPLCTDGPARTRREAAWQAAAPATSAGAAQGQGRGSLRRAGPPGPAAAP